jgi:putative oxidoreductase
MTLTACGIVLAGIGAGRWSLDRALGWFQPPGWAGLALGVIVGFGGAGALLAACWRPPRAATD